MDRRAWSLLLALSAIWGASYMLIKIGVRDLSPGMLAFARVALGAVFLLGFAWSRGALAGFAGVAGSVVLIGLSQIAGPFLLLAAGETEISSSLAGILVTSAPIFTALLAIRVDQEERLGGARLWGILIGLVGVALLLGVDLGHSGDQLLGGLAVLGAGFGYAVGGLLAKHRLAGKPSIGVAAWVTTAGGVLLLPVAVAGWPTAAPSVGPAVAVAVLGFVGTGVAFAIFYELVATIGPGRAYTVTYIAPGFAVVYGAILLEERITVATVCGLALIVVGSYLAAGGVLRSRPRREGARPGTAKALP
jgi:drug/metabolite transporter (DMT)-like permease